MSDELKSVFRGEIETNLIIRKEELSSEAFRHYRKSVQLFDNYLYDINLGKKSIEEPVIEGWIKGISKGSSINTVAGHVHNIRQLLMFFVNNGYRCFIPHSIVRKDTYVPYLYTDHDIENIFKAADSFATSCARVNVYIAYEMPLLLRLLFCCGLRLGETINIKVGDIDFDRNLIVLRVTKKYKQRLVPYDASLAEIIYRYCVAMGIINDNGAYLFPANDKYDHVSASSVGNYFRAIRKEAGIDDSGIKSSPRGACLHCFRHTFAVRSFDKNERKGISSRESVPFLSTYLGHDSLYETEKYLKYSGNYFEDTLTKFQAFAEGLFPEVGFDE